MWVPYTFPAHDIFYACHDTLDSNTGVYSGILLVINESS